MLRGDHHAFDAGRAAVAVFDGDLRLSIGPEKINFIGFANLGEALREAGASWMGMGINSSVSSQAKPNIKPWSPAPRCPRHGDVRRLPLHRAHTAQVSAS